MKTRTKIVNHGRKTKALGTIKSYNQAKKEKIGNKMTLSPRKGRPGERLYRMAPNFNMEQLEVYIHHNEEEFEYN